MRLEAAHTICAHLIAEWWHHTPPKETPQVFKSSTAVFFLSSLYFFYLLTSTPHLYSSFPTDLLHFTPHHPLFSSFVKWSLRPIWSPLKPPPLPLLMCQARPFSWLSATFFNLTHIPNLTRLGFHHFVFFFRCCFSSPFRTFSSHLTFMFGFCLNVLISTSFLNLLLQILSFFYIILHYYSFIYLIWTDKEYKF